MTPIPTTTVWEQLVPTMSEKDWMRHLVEAAGDLGWLVYHPWLSANSESGFPDLVCIRERIVYIECKREGRDLTAKQRAWAEALRAAGAEVYAPARPSDYEQLLGILSTHRSNA